MPLSLDRQAELKQATINYLSRLKLITPWHHSRAAIYIQPHCYLKLFSSPRKSGAFHVGGPIRAWEEYLNSIGTIADGLINFGTVSRFIDEALKSYSVIPLETHQCEMAATNMVGWFNRCYDYRTTSYVPLSNIKLSRDVESIQLAKTKLCRGFSSSEFSEHIARLPSDVKFDVPKETCFLKFDTMGDDESIERQIIEKTQQALRVLRFCSGTNSQIKGTRRQSYNQARDVNYFPYHAPAGHYLYTNSNNHPFNRQLVDRTSPSRVEIDNEQVEKFNRMGRELLNTHFANAESPISEHILLVLEWYDSGLQANTNRDAIYRFLVCLNAIVGWNYSKDKLASPILAQRLKKLFVANASYENEVYHLNLYGRFEGLESLSNWNPQGKPPGRVIEKLLGRFSDLFNILYQEQRNSILHGKPHKSGKPVSSQDVKNAQLLAQNGLRLIMKLIADNPTWINREDIENWFCNGS